MPSNRGKLFRLCRIRRQVTRRFAVRRMVFYLDYGTESGKLEAMTTTTPAMTYPHLTVTRNGFVHIEATRYTVQHLAAEHYHHGWSAEEILHQHSDLRPEQVYSALAYFYDHFDELVTALKESALSAEAARSPPPFSRDELLKRGHGRSV